MDPRPTVLVVDDAPENIALLSEILKESCRVLAATSGETALTAAREKAPDLILLDVMMPGMDGHEVCRVLKAHPDTHEIPVIFVTAMGEMCDEMEGLSLGAVDYVTKPLWPPLVKKRVQNQLELAAAHRRIADLSAKYASYLSPELSDGIKVGTIIDGFSPTRKKLTVFFSDIAGFTRLSEHMDPAKMTTLLNEYFEEMNEIVAAHGGTLDKYIGDAILVFFGDPRSRGEKADAAACVSMALAMQARLATLRRKWKERGIDEAIRVRMGISTGYATVGNYGSRHKREYTIVGPPVNLAFRLESHAAVDSILIAEETWRLVREEYECRPREAMQLKGISRPVRPYQVMGNGRHRWYEFESGENWLHVNPFLLDHRDRGRLRRLLGVLLRRLEEPVTEVDGDER